VGGYLVTTSAPPRHLTRRPPGRRNHEMDRRGPCRSQPEAASYLEMGSQSRCQDLHLAHLPPHTCRPTPRTGPPSPTPPSAGCGPPGSPRSPGGSRPRTAAPTRGSGSSAAPRHPCLAATCSSGTALGLGQIRLGRPAGGARPAPPHSRLSPGSDEGIVRTDRPTRASCVGCQKRTSADRQARKLSRRK
jgi:hypothetical protein